MTILVKKVFISSKPTFVCLLCPPLCGPFSIQESAAGGLSYKAKKSCSDCLSRKNRAGETEYFHRSVICMTVGKTPHVILGQEMLKPRDGAEKDEGELTGGKKLIRRLKERHGHFADVIVADALYLNAPFINTIKECGLDAVIRLKDERRELFQDAESLFKRDEGKKGRLPVEKRI